jgi:hypothetical protein
MLGPRALVAALITVGGCHLVVGVGDLEYVTCVSPDQCASGACVDGFCCDRACDGDCEACNVAGVEGICSPSPAGNADCAAGIGVCDGGGRCAIGAVAWLQRLGEESDQRAHGVAVVGTRVYVTGSFTGTIFNVTTEPDDEDGFVGLLVADDGSPDAAGGITLSDVDTASTRPQSVNAIAASSTRAAIAGYCQGEVRYGTYNATCDSGNGDMFWGALGDGLGPAVMEDPFPRAISSVGRQMAEGVAAGLQGDVVVCGSFDGSLGEATANGTDGFVAVFSNNFENRWTKAIGAEGDSAAHAVAVDPQGRVVVVGDYQGGLGLGEVPTAATTHAFVSVFSPTGQHEWSAGFGSDGSEQRALGVAVNSHGEIAVVGSFGGSMQFERTLASVGGDDIFVALLAPDGTPLWSLQLGDGADQAAYAVAVDDRDAIIVAGGFAGTLQEVVSTGGEDAFVLKLARNGTPLWLHGDGSTGEDRATSVTVDASGSIYAAGHAADSIDFGANNPPPANGDLDAFVVKWAP